MTTSFEQDLAVALEEVYGSDQSLEAGAVLVQLRDLGWRIELLRPGRFGSLPAAMVPLRPATERGPVSDSKRHLTVGLWLTANPCVVEVEDVTPSTGYVHCETCDDSHLIDRPLYEAGRGPWRPKGSEDLRCGQRMPLYHLRPKDGK